MGGAGCGSVGGNPGPTFRFDPAAVGGVPEVAPDAAAPVMYACTCGSVRFIVVVGMTDCTMDWYCCAVAASTPGKVVLTISWL